MATTLRRRRARRRTSSAAPGHPVRRARVMLVAAAFVLTLFVGQLFRLQALDGPALAQTALSSRMVTERVPALRGSVVDDGGTVLARSVPTRHVTADPELLRNYDGSPKRGIAPGSKGAAEALARELGLDQAEARELRRAIDEAPGRFLYVAKDVTPSDWRAVDDLRLPGVRSEPSSVRTYPLGSTSAPLIGWVNSQQVGSGGVEAMQEKTLAGTPGTLAYQRSAAGGRIATTAMDISEAQPGRDVQLTIDSDIQFKAEQLLAEQVRKMGGISGTAIVQRTDGDVLAAASYPGFDPTGRVKDPTERNNPIFTEVFEPGSTGKVVTASAALEEGLVAPETKLVVPNRLPRSDKKFKDSHDYGTRYLTFAGVLATSSNIGTIMAGEELGRDRLHDYLSAFGMGRSSGLGFPGESAGILAPPEKWSDTQYYTAMFGQGVSGTAIQQNTVFQTLANGGVRVAPRLVRATREQDGPWEETPKDAGERVVSQRTADEMTRMLTAVPTQEGTAPQAAVPGYAVAGKTSTAQRYDPEKGRYDGVTASFAGYAPADDPQLVVSVTVQKPEVAPWGGVVAGPVFSDLMGFALRHEGVAPSAERAEHPPLTFDPRELVERAPRGGDGGSSGATPSDAPSTGTTPSPGAPATGSGENAPTAPSDPQEQTP
ncbi:peptidoglycan D,D-transpeptidase FtsI family protein [Kytococcus schroeteri]|uniref:peptidoglycan D,D-transpeptidase FtsI family protein n=1 Tax=Kytococcus schroeteri TaxID=138300 RepID=UPI0035E493A4